MRAKQSVNVYGLYPAYLFNISNVYVCDNKCLFDDYLTFYAYFCGVVVVIKTLRETKTKRRF